MKRLFSYLLLPAVIILLLTGCHRNGFGTAAVNTAEFSDKGSIRVTSVEPFDISLYSERELREMIDEEIAAAGSSNVSMESLSVKDNVATLVMDYASSDAFCRFNEGVRMFYGTCGDAVAAGLDLSPLYGQPSAVKSSRIMTVNKLTELKDNRLIYVTVPQDLILPGPVLFVTSNVKVEENDRVSLSSTVSGTNPAILILQ